MPRQIDLRMIRGTKPKLFRRIPSRWADRFSQRATCTYRDFVTARHIQVASDDKAWYQSVGFTRELSVALHSTISNSMIDSSWCPGEPPPSEGLQHTVGFIEMELRALNLRKDTLSERIAAIKRTVIGLAQLFGAEIVNKQLLNVRFSESPGRRPAHRGLTDSCRQLLRSRPCHAFALREIVDIIRNSHPALLAHHKCPTDSLRVIMKRLVRYGEAVEMFVDVDRLAWKADSAKAPDTEPNVRSQSRRQNPALSRACRIALLENSAFMSEKEIYSRIVRRGSFTFTNTRLAAAAVSHELNTLIERGQARCIEMGNEQCWQRAIPADDVEASVRLTNAVR